MTRALVTGAASGLGAAVARSLHAEGWSVAGLDLNPVSDADLAFEVDVSDDGAVASAVAESVMAFGGLDAVVHAAGVVLDASTPIGDVSAEMVRRTFEINSVGAFLVARECLPPLVSSRGAIVFVSSAVARTPQSGVGAYAMSKAAVSSLSRSIALEYAHAGVRSVSVSPGYMDTEMARPVMERPSFREAVEASIPLGRVAAAEEVASLISWLVSPAASYVTGEDIVIDGAKHLTPYSSTQETQRLWQSREEK